MEHESMFPQSEREVLVTLLDGRVLEGKLLCRTDHYEINGTLFYEHEIEELIDDE
jgi:hypothetical protein